LLERSVDFIPMREAPAAFPVSTRLRNASVQAIREMARPMAAQEITDWLNEHDLDLAQQVAAKCYDYVRIILSLSPTNLLIKYRPVGRIDGVDQRAAFYGLAGVAYDSAAWTLSDLKQRKRIPSATARARPSLRGKRPKANVRPPSEESSPLSTPGHPMELGLPAPAPQKICLFPNPIRNMQVMEPVDLRAVTKAWETLACIVRADDPLWQELQTAIGELRSQMENGSGALEGIDAVVRNHARFLNPLIADDVSRILAKVAYDKQEEIASPPQFDFWIW
jgi:hypothetical protein